MLSSTLLFSFTIPLLRKLVSETVSSQDFLYSAYLAPPDPHWRVHLIYVSSYVSFCGERPSGKAFATMSWRWVSESVTIYIAQYWTYG